MGRGFRGGFGGLLCGFLKGLRAFGRAALLQIVLGRTLGGRGILRLALRKLFGGLLLIGGRGGQRLSLFFLLVVRQFRLFRLTLLRRLSGLSFKLRLIPLGLGGVQRRLLLRQLGAQLLVKVFERLGVDLVRRIRQRLAKRLFGLRRLGGGTLELLRLFDCSIVRIVRLLGFLGEFRRFGGEVLQGLDGGKRLGVLQVPFGGLLRLCRGREIRLRERLGGTLLVGRGLGELLRLQAELSFRRGLRRVGLALHAFALGLLRVQLPLQRGHLAGGCLHLALSLGEVGVGVLPGEFVGLLHRSLLETLPRLELRCVEGTLRRDFLGGLRERLLPCGEVLRLLEGVHLLRAIFKLLRKVVHLLPRLLHLRQDVVHGLRPLVAFAEGRLFDRLQGGLQRLFEHPVEGTRQRRKPLVGEEVVTQLLDALLGLGELVRETLALLLGVLGNLLLAAQRVPHLTRQVLRIVQALARLVEVALRLGDLALQLLQLPGCLVGRELDRKRHRRRRVGSAKLGRAGVGDDHVKANVLREDEVVKRKVDFSHRSDERRV